MAYSKFLTNGRNSLKSIFMKRLVLKFVLLCVFSSLASAREPSDSDVLVFGGTGRLGSEVVSALLSQGHSVTVFARPSSNRQRLEGLDVAFVTGDVLDEADVAAALSSKQFEIIIDALGRGSAGPDFYRISAQHIAQAAARIGVEQLILHGSVGAGESSKIFGSISEGMNQLMQSKTAGENVVIESGVPYTIIRNYSIRPHGTPATGKARLIDDQTAFGPISRADLALLTLQCVDNKKCHNKIYHGLDPSLMANPPSP